MNICEELRCPFALKNGCDRYTVSNVCPVAWIAPGMPHPEIRANQYWLYATDNADIDINERRQTLEAEVLKQESSIRWLEMREQMDDRPVMVWGEEIADSSERVNEVADTLLLPPKINRFLYNFAYNPVSMQYRPVSKRSRRRFRGLMRNLKHKKAMVAKWISAVEVAIVDVQTEGGKEKYEQ